MSSSRANPLREMAQRSAEDHPIPRAPDEVLGENPLSRFRHPPSGLIRLQEDSRIPAQGIGELVRRRLLPNDPATRTATAERHWDVSRN
ncbi:hypothetical protein [Streptomyces sp. 3N207]|uniref:hypothetical protein n=1 Tax=Streptomyces sp. 3N207 TaxID=3457417 RepID=UPI003FD21414